MTFKELAYIAVRVYSSYTELWLRVESHYKFYKFKVISCLATIQSNQGGDLRVGESMKTIVIIAMFPQ